MIATGHSIPLAAAFSPPRREQESLAQGESSRERWRMDFSDGGCVFLVSVCVGVEVLCFMF
jgi:hypothetical protein